MYGQIKLFETSEGNVLASTRAEAAQRARSLKGKEPSFIRGPNFTTALRGEPTGNRKHPDVTYVGTRAAVRRLNRAFA